MINAELQEHLVTYDRTADVKMRVRIDANTLTNLMRGAVMGSVELTVDITSFNIVTDDSGQVIHLCNTVGQSC